jgi:hypothetical protein
MMPRNPIKTAAASGLVQGRSLPSCVISSWRIPSACPPRQKRASASPRSPRSTTTSRTIRRTPVAVVSASLAAVLICVLVEVGRTGWYVTPVPRWSAQHRDKLQGPRPPGRHGPCQLHLVVGRRRGFAVVTKLQQNVVRTPNGLPRRVLAGVYRDRRIALTHAASKAASAPRRTATIFTRPSAVTTPSSMTMSRVPGGYSCGRTGLTFASNFGGFAPGGRLRTAD